MPEEKVAELKVTKSPEEIKAEEEKAKKEREARFYENPDSFVEMKDLVVGGMMTEKGPAILLNKASRDVYHHIMGELQHRMSMELTRQDIVAAKNKPGIIVPDGVNRNKLRGFLRRK